MAYIPIEEVDVDRIPRSGLDRYTKEELQHIARYALQRLDIRLLRDRWDVLDEKTNEKKLMRLIKRFGEYGAKS